MTLWESAEIKNCSHCGDPCKVWNPFKAHDRGESTISAPWGPIDQPYINPLFKSYEDVCSECRRESINRLHEMKYPRKVQL